MFPFSGSKDGFYHLRENLPVIEKFTVDRCQITDSVLFKLSSVTLSSANYLKEFISDIPPEIHTVEVNMR